MSLPGVITSQTGGRLFDRPEITNYSLFVGGTNASHHALRNYSPQLNGYGRLFMVRPPRALLTMFSGGNDAYLYSPNNLFIQYKHMLEYMHRAVEGFQEKQLENAATPIAGGFAGRQFNVPTVTKETTNTFTIQIHESVGSPIYTVTRDWMNAIGDENSGLATYGGFVSGGRNLDGLETRLNALNHHMVGAYAPGIEYNEANHTAEFIYVLHDKTGAQVERAVFLAGCYPQNIQQDIQLNMTFGQHDVPVYNLTFNCIMYSSTLINVIATDLLRQYRIVSNSLNFNPELGDAVFAPNDPSMFNLALGPVPVDSATGTNIGNTPAFYARPNARTRPMEHVDINRGRLSGQPGFEARPDTEGFTDEPFPHWDNQMSLN